MSQKVETCCRNTLFVNFHQKDNGMFGNIILHLQKEAHCMLHAASLSYLKLGKKFYLLKEMISAAISTSFLSLLVH